MENNQRVVELKIDASLVKAYKRSGDIHSIYSLYESIKRVLNKFDTQETNEYWLEHYNALEFVINERLEAIKEADVKVYDAELQDYLINYPSTGQ